jgi:uncharacterized protein with HEPN domain
LHRSIRRERLYLMRDVRGYLWDVSEAARAIAQFVEGIDAVTYTESELIHSAVERKFEIFGEALSLLSKIDFVTASRIPDSRQIIAFRNVLIHGYAVVEHDRVWNVIKQSLPNLAAVVTALLNERED